jgi:hypothetical protein
MLLSTAVCAPDMSCLAALLQVSLDVSIAVGLNNTQAASGAGQLSATFLNSTALGDILKDFNLSARPTEWIDTFLGPNRTAPFWRIPGLLSSPSPSPPTKPGPGRSPTPSDVEDVPAGPPSTRDKGFYAAIAVAITVATAALIGLIVVIIKRRRETSGAAAQREQKAGGVELTNGGAGGGAGQQRRTRVSGGGCCWQQVPYTNSYNSTNCSTALHQHPSCCLNANQRTVPCSILLLAGDCNVNSNKLAAGVACCAAACPPTGLQRQVPARPRPAYSACGCTCTRRQPRSRQQRRKQQQWCQQQ